MKRVLTSSLNAPIRAYSYPDSPLWNNFWTHPWYPRGGGVLPIMTYKGRLYPKGAPFSGFRYTWLYERVGISLVEVYERNSLILVCNKAQKDYQWILWLWLKFRKCSGLRFIHILKPLHLQQLKGMQSFKLGMWKGAPFVNRRYRKGYFFSIKWSIKG